MFSPSGPGRPGQPRADEANASAGLPRLPPWASSHRSPSASGRSPGCRSCFPRSCGWTGTCTGSPAAGSVLDIAGLPNLNLTVKGRKSGIERTTPLLCVPDGDTILIAGSYFGGPKMPLWVGNLRAAGWPRSSSSASVRGPGDRARGRGPRRGLADDAADLAQLREVRGAHRPGHPGLPAGAGHLGPSYRRPCSTASIPPPGSRSPTSATSTCSPTASGSTAWSSPRTGCAWLWSGWAGWTGTPGAGVHRRPRRPGRAGRLRAAARAGRAGRGRDGRPGRLGHRQPRRAGAVRPRALRHRRRRPPGPGPRRRRAADGRARHQRPRLPPRRAAARAARLAPRRALHPAEHGTLLAMHHPPIPVPTMEPAAIIELLDQDRLAAVIEGTDVRQVLGGHFHYTSSAPSPASRSRWPRPAATPRTPPRWSG